MQVGGRPDLDGQVGEAAQLWIGLDRHAEQMGLIARTIRSRTGSVDSRAPVSQETMAD